MSKLALNTKNWKIKTDGGFIPFEGVSPMGIKQLYKVSFDDNSFIEVSDKHTFFTPDGREIQTRELTIGLVLIGIQNKTVVGVEQTTEDQTYDIIESKTHTFFANGLLCHNCHFLSSEALLINSLVLANMTQRIEAIRPVNVVKDVVLWHEIKPGVTYLVGVDPSSGTGEDFSVITLYEFPVLRQVGEYRSNTMSTNDLYGVLKNILLYLENKGTEVYFSIESNGVGEGVISLYEADEHPPDNAEFVSEEGRNKRGMTTTSKTKMRACVNLKEMLEKGNLEISSPVMLAELKMFVRTKGAYAAQPGGTDDVISATLIIVRLIEEIATYNQTAFDQLYCGDFDKWGEDEWDGYEEGYDEHDQGIPMSFG